ncbi:MAG: nucleoside permease [Candidatus Hydrogenedentes bacterium]|nr:nucleoside permease [Candidatus Hydrogenedentota bacterium]
MNPTARIQLSVMMFIQFFVWGVWFVTLGTYLGGLKFSGAAIGNAYSTTNWAAIVSPFFVGMIADRFFSAEKVMGILHLAGGLVLYYLSKVTDPGEFFFVALAYALCYMPTLALVNAISFHQMSDPAKQFPGVRVLGTIGWIVAGFVASFLGEGTNRPIIAAAVASLILGIYCFTLPNTPPKSHGKKVTVSDILGLDALRLLKDWSFSVFIVCSLLICIPLAFYYNYTNMFLNAHEVANAAAKQSMGQMSEVFFMLVMPFFFARLGVKKMLLVGMIAWAVRYFFFAYGNSGSLIMLWYIGILLHGICYDFFFVTGQLYVDKKAPEDVRASAQGFIGLVTYGAGMAIGSTASGHIVDYFKLSEAVGKVEHNWTSLWLVPGTMAIVITVLFVLFFHENNKDKASA